MSLHTRGQLSEPKGREVRKAVQLLCSRWRKVSRVTCDRKMARENGETYKGPAMTYSSEGKVAEMKTDQITNEYKMRYLGTKKQG